MNNKPTVTIWRKGKFTVPNLDPINQCGRPGQTEFSYHVTMTVDTLDNHGFVCDNFNVPKMFDRYKEGRWQASCEQLAGSGIYMMHKLCEDRAMKITCEISPIGEAGVMVEWNHGQAMPTFYAKRLDKREAILAAKPAKKSSQRTPRDLYRKDQMPWFMGELARGRKFSSDTINKLELSAKHHGIDLDAGVKETQSAW